MHLHLLCLSPRHRQPSDVSPCIYLSVSVYLQPRPVGLDSWHPDSPESKIFFRVRFWRGCEEWSGCKNMARSFTARHACILSLLLWNLFQFKFNNFQTFLLSFTKMRKTTKFSNNQWDLLMWHPFCIAVATQILFQLMFFIDSLNLLSWFTSSHHPHHPIPYIQTHIPPLPAPLFNPFFLNVSTPTTQIILPPSHPLLPVFSEGICHRWLGEEVNATLGVFCEWVRLYVHCKSIVSE